MNPSPPPSPQPNLPEASSSGQAVRQKNKIVFIAVFGAVVVLGVILFFLLSSSWLQDEKVTNSNGSQENQNTDANTAKEAEKPTDKQTEEPVKPVSEACLVGTDAHDYFGVDERYSPQDVTKYFYSETVYFNADSADYSNPEAAKSRYDKLAGFYSEYSKKAFLYHVQATTYEDNTSQEGTRVANARAERAQKELTDRGIPSSFVVIDQPRTSTYNAEGMRNVVITIKGSKDC